MSAREDAVAALCDMLQGTGADVWRGTDVARQIDPDGTIEVMEGEHTQEAILSPLRWMVDLNVDVAISVVAADEHTRDARLDSLLATIGDLITADRTLGGVVEHTEPSAVAFEIREADGAAKTARLTVVLSFTTDDTILS